MYLYLSSSSTKWLTPARFVFLIFFFVSFFFFSLREEDVSYDRHLAQKRLWPCLEGGDICWKKKKKKGNNFITFHFLFSLKKKEEELVRAAMFIQTFARCLLLRASLLQLLLLTGRHRTDGLSLSLSLKSFRSFNQINSRKLIRSNDCGGIWWKLFHKFQKGRAR